MKKQFLNAIAKKLEKEYTVAIVVSIECPSIYLFDCHSFDVIKIDETKTTIDIDTTDMCFKIGKNYIDIFYDEIEDEYTFRYENDVIITVAII